MDDVTSTEVIAKGVCIFFAKFTYLLTYVFVGSIHQNTLCPKLKSYSRQSAASVYYLSGTFPGNKITVWILISKD